jgi:hypothetical protein
VCGEFSAQLRRSSFVFSGLMEGLLSLSSRLKNHLLSTNILGNDTESMNDGLPNHSSLLPNWFLHRLDRNFVLPILLASYEFAHQVAHY